MSKVSPRTVATATMYTGMVATLGGNAATADWSDPLGVVLAAFPALALFLTFEMVVRVRAVPSKRKWYHHAMRLVPAMGIMAGAAYVSVGHLLELAHAHGQHGGRAWTLALLPDAMMILAAVVLKDCPQTRTTPAKPSARKAPARKPAAAKPSARKAPARKAPAPIVTPLPSPSTLLLPGRRRGTQVATA
jgi:hypothetical protein